MNLVGKIFIVLIFLMSTLFMGFAVAIYASHVNWKTAAAALEDQLTEEKSKSVKLSDERDRLETERGKAEMEQRKALSSLATEKQTLEAQQEEATKQLTALNQDVRDATATLGTAHATLADLRKQVVGLRDEIRKEQEEKDAAFSDVVELTDQLHDLANDLKTLQDRNKELAEVYADAKEVLRKHDLNENPAVYADEAAKVDGLVLAVRDTGLIEVSIGKDDGLVSGHTLEVYRIADGLSTYLGKVEVAQVEPDKAACKILPEFRKGTIQKGDSVASKLK